MVKKRRPQRKVRRLVVVFDICSSTLILEDLIRSENQQKWCDLLVYQKNFLRRKREEYGFEMYKFLGDGWILLFDPGVDGSNLLDLLRRLCTHFESRYKRGVEPVLSTDMSIVGLTFGIDEGTLIYMTMNGQREYMGRPLNVAARLQSSISDKDRAPQNKILMSRSVFAGFSDGFAEKCRVKSVTRELKNVSGGEKYLCTKVTLFPNR